MRRETPSNVPASVRQRLLNFAEENGHDFQDVLRRYGAERFLYRLSQSEFSQQLILKGAALFLVWTGAYYRPTRDIDLLKLGPPDIKQIEGMMRSICRIQCGEDGVIFPENSVRVWQIKEDDEYGGIRATFEGKLGRIRIPMQVDIGTGDAVTPPCKVEEYPAILGANPLRVVAYPRETVVAEKFEAMVELAMKNSRMKDFYDLWALASDFEFDGIVLCKATKATFLRRKTPLPETEPTALTPDFFKDQLKTAQWKAFLGKGEFKKQERDFGKVVRLIADFVMPPVRALVKHSDFDRKWSPGGHWK